MDPNAAWDEIMGFLNRVDYDDDDQDRVNDVCNGLTHWLGHSGFMPDKAVAAGFTREGVARLCYALAEYTTIS